MTFPLSVDSIPLGLGQLVNVRRDTVMLSRANQMLGEITLGNIPIDAQLAEGLYAARVRTIRFWLDREVRVAQLVGPFVGRV